MREVGKVCVYFQSGEVAEGRVERLDDLIDRDTVLLTDAVFNQTTPYAEFTVATHSVAGFGLMSGVANIGEEFRVKDPPRREP